MESAPIDELSAAVGYNGEKIAALIGHKEMESPETFLRLRSEIDDDAKNDEETSPGYECLESELKTVT